MSALAQFPKAPALATADWITPEAAAKQLFPGNCAARRGVSHEVLHELRRIYVDGVYSRRGAEHLGWWNEAEQWIVPGPSFASSWGERERKAYAWGWEDAEIGRFAR